MSSQQQTPTTPSAPTGCELAEVTGSALPRLRTHLAQLAPHVKARATGQLLKDAADEISRLLHEHSVLCDFINREMKMTASDPRIAELQKRMDAKPNTVLTPRLDGVQAAVGNKDK